MISKHVLGVLFMAMLAAALVQGQGTYNVVYEADKDGQKIAGSLSDLTDRVTKGSPLRVGWVLRFVNPENGKVMEMEHWADAGFVTVLGGHVFAQLRSIYEQGPGMGTPPAVWLSNGKPHGWVAIIGTTGVMRQKYDTEALKTSLKASGMTADEITAYMKESETMKIHTKWAVPIQ